MRPYIFPLVHFIKWEKIRLYRANKRLNLERYDSRNKRIFGKAFYNEQATDNASLSSRDEKKGNYNATLNDWYKEDDNATTWDDISLKGCKQKITIKLYSMELTKSGSNADLDDDMYDLFAGEDTDRAIIN